MLTVHGDFKISLNTLCNLTIFFNKTILLLAFDNLYEPIIIIVSLLFAEYLFRKPSRKLPRMKLKVEDVNTQSSSLKLKVVSLTYLSSADAALSPVAVSDIEISW